MLKYTFWWTYTTVQSPLWPCPCPLSVPQFWRSIPDRDTDPPLALSLTTLHTSYCKILHKKFFFTTFHTSYFKHCTRSYFHNFEHILLQNIAQDIVYNFARMLSQNIVQEISPAIETLVLKIDFWLIIEILHSTKFCAPKSQCNSPWNVCKKINSLTFFPPVGWTSWSYWVGKLRIDRGEIARISHILVITMYPNLFSVSCNYDFFFADFKSFGEKLAVKASDSIRMVQEGELQEYNFWCEFFLL